MLILSPESVAHFYPASPEQLINACYEAGFRAVTRGVIGDELVAAEYLKLWEEEPWGTLIRSTDPVVVETVRTQYPELLPYLAPVTLAGGGRGPIPASAARAGVKIVFAGVCPPVGGPDLDAAITFGDLDQLFRIRGVSVLAQPTFFQRVPEERRRHLSAAGGLPLALLEESRYSSRRFRKIRGLDALPARGPGGGGGPARPRLRGHPVDGGGAGPPAARARRRSCTGGASCWPAPRRRGAGSRWWTGPWWRASGPCFAFKPRRPVPDPEAVAGVLAQIGARPERAPVGLPGVRVRHLQAVRGGGGAGTGVDAPVHARTRSAGPTRRSARRPWTT